MSANNKVIDDIKRSMRLSDYIGQFTLQPPKRSGGEGKFLALCPLHDNTKSPAMSINDSKGLWKCFAGCGAGSIFDFWLIQNGYDPHDRGNFGQAVEGLAKELGVDLPEFKKEGREISASKIKSVLGAVSDAATDYLFDGDEDGADKAYNYLIERGFTDKLIKKYRIGFFPESNRDAIKMIRKAAGDDYGMKAAIAGAIANESENGDEYTPLHGRIVIPITDRFGNVLGFGAREVPGVKHWGDGKWINPTTTSVYDKSKTLFDGGEFARNKNVKSVVICEGYFDAIAVTESESDAIGLAVCGTSTTPAHLESIHSADSITFMFDGDEAGMSATSRLTWAVNKREDLYAVILENGIDPFDVVFSGQKEITISDLIQKARPILVVAVDVERERKEKNDDFDKWVANALSAIESEQQKNQFAEIAAKKRGQTRSAYIRNLSRIKVKTLTYDDDEVRESKIDANSQLFISFVLSLSDDEKDGLFYHLKNRDILDVCSQWLRIESDLALATFTAALFGSSITKSDIPKTDVDRELAALMTEDEVDISRPLKSVLALLNSNVRSIIASGVSPVSIKRLVGIRELIHMSEDVTKQKDVLAMVIDLAFDIMEWKEASSG